MKKITTLIYIKYIVLKRKISNIREKNPFSALIFILLSLLVLTGINIFCYKLFSYIHNFDKTGRILNIKILEYFTIFIFIMDFLSNIITSLNISMDRNELFFLMKTPVTSKAMSVYKSFEITFISNWMAYFIGFSIFSAWAYVSKINLLLFFIIFSILWGMLLFIASLSAFFVVESVLSIFPVKWISSFINFTIISFSVGLIFVLRALKPEKLINPDVRFALREYILSINIPFQAYLPTHWVISALSNYKDFIFSFINLIAVILFFLIFIIVVGKKALFRKIILTSPRKLLHSSFTKLSIFSKDLKVFLRTSTEINQLIIVLGIVVLYGYNMSIIPQKNLFHTFAVNIINMAIYILIIITISSRFVLSSFTKEFENLWILLSSPVTASKMINEKVKFALLFNVPLGLFLSSIPAIILPLPFFFKVYNFIIGFCISLCISFITIYYSVVIIDSAPMRNEALIMTPTGFIYMVNSFLFTVFYIALYFGLLHSYFVKMYIYSQYGNFLSFVLIINVVMLLYTFIICKKYYKGAILKVKSINFGEKV